MNVYGSNRVEDARKFVVRWGVLEIDVPVCDIENRGGDPIFAERFQSRRCER
jgi:hypothetical protein